MGGPETLAFAGGFAYSDRQGDGGVGLLGGFLGYKSVRGSALYAFLPRQDPSACPTLVQYGHLRKSRQTGCTQGENEADARSTVAEMIA
jgi:hypothetical protein